MPASRLTDGDARALGLRGGHRHDGRRLRRSRRRAATIPQRMANCIPTALLTDADRHRSDGVLPQPIDGGRRVADAPFRHSRLRDVGAHRVRVGRPGDRHGAEADSPRQRRLRARRRFRFDDQPGGLSRLLPPLGRLRRQRHAAAREPSLRRHAQRLRPRRGRGLRRARGLGDPRGAVARASTPNSPATATRSRRTASPIRRPTATDPIQSMRAAIERRRRDARRTSTTSTPTARRR